jgi:hypothetical protein
MLGGLLETAFTNPTGERDSRSEFEAAEVLRLRPLGGACVDGGSMLLLLAAARRGDVRVAGIIVGDFFEMPKPSAGCVRDGNGGGRFSSPIEESESLFEEESEGTAMGDAFFAGGGVGFFAAA